MAALYDQAALTTPQSASWQWGQAQLQAAADDEIPADRLSYLVSNAIAAETLAIDAFSMMVPLMPTAPSRMEMVNSAAMASRHFLLLAQLSRTLGIATERGNAEPAWRGLRRHLRDAVRAGDLAAHRIICEVAAEAIAASLYELLAATAGTAASLASNILGERLERSAIGLWQLRMMIEANPGAAADAVRWAHHRMMPELHAIIGRLPDESGDHRGAGAKSWNNDYRGIERSRLSARASERYREALLCLFGDLIAGSLLAGLSVFRGSATSGAAPCAAEATCCQTADEPRRC